MWIKTLRDEWINLTHAHSIFVRQENAWDGEGKDTHADFMVVVAIRDSGYVIKCFDNHNAAIIYAERLILEANRKH